MFECSLTLTACSGFCSTAGVDYLEGDLGQTEFTPAGCLSLITVTEPLLGKLSTSGLILFICLNLFVFVILVCFCLFYFRGKKVKLIKDLILRVDVILVKFL